MYKTKECTGEATRRTKNDKIEYTFDEKHNTVATKDNDENEEKFKVEVSVDTLKMSTPHASDSFDLAKAKITETFKSESSFNK